MITLVLDTNVVLDWLVFCNPAAAPIEAELAAGRARWLVTAPMREEFERVLRYPAIAAWAVDRARIDAAFAGLAAAVDAPHASVAQGLRCTDADDQKFIDLALAARAQWLLTRDRAVLKLARRSRSFGVLIAVPERFAPLR